MDPESGSSSGSGVQWTKIVYHPLIVKGTWRNVNGRPEGEKADVDYKVFR